MKRTVNDALVTKVIESPGDASQIFTIDVPRSTKTIQQIRVSIDWEGFGDLKLNLVRKGQKVYNEACFPELKNTRLNSLHQRLDYRRLNHAR